MKSKIPEILKNFKPTENGGLMYSLDDMPTPLITNDNYDMLMIYLNLQSIIFFEEKITFPNRMETFYVDISLKDDLNIKGIRECVEVFKDNLEKGKSFIKTNVYYRNSNSIPTIRIHFITFGEGLKNEIIGETLLYPHIFFQYDENIFTDERVKKMNEEGINSDFIKILPNTNICPVKFENGELLPLFEIEKYREQYEN